MDSSTLSELLKVTQSVKAALDCIANLQAYCRELNERLLKLEKNLED